MVQTTRNQHDAHKFETTVAKTIDATPEDIYAAFSTVDQISRWWGPKGFTVPEATLEFRTGGSFRICIESDGKKLWQHGVFRELDEPSRIAFTFAWEKSEEQPLGEGMITVIIQPQGKQSRVSLRHAGLPSQEEADGHNSGWNECLDRLAETVGRKH
jgi:uncharacterized protein YndB with AHSA1/START domain